MWLKPNISNPRDPRDEGENIAFSAYAKHTQEVEDAINTIVNQFRAGNYSFTMNFDDDISDSDVEYIQAEVERRL